jgi:hypothetical protein
MKRDIKVTRIGEYGIIRFGDEFGYDKNFNIGDDIVIDGVQGRHKVVGVQPAVSSVGGYIRLLRVE